MKHIFSIALLFSALAYAEDTRRFTDTQGRSINAKILEHDSSSGKILIERAGKKAVWISPSTFSQSDQLYIQKWINDSKFMTEAFFNIVVEEHKSNWESCGDASGNRRKKSSSFTFVFNNRNNEPLNDLRLEYCLFRDRNRNGDKFIESKIYDLEVGTIDKNSEKKIRAKVGHLSFKASGFLNEVAGLSLRVYMETSKGETLMREVRYQDKLSKEKYVWGNTES